MRSATIRQFRSGIVLSIAVAGSALAEANSVNVIYASENALYGAGYDIGRADGWMDETLRRAVRDYQTRAGNLSVTGDLDSATLSALGISETSGRAVSGNVVASKAEALAALGMSAKSTDSTPRPQRQPKPAFSVQELPVEPKPEPVRKQALSNPTPATAKVVAKAKPAPTNPVEVTPPVVEARPQTPKVVAAPSEAPVPEPVAPAAPSSPPSPEVAELASQQPEEPAGADQPEASDGPTSVAEEVEATSQAASTEVKPEKKSRNIFGTLFDFLFGWMV